MVLPIMCGRAQPTPTCCRHRGRCRFAGALSHVRLSYKRFSSCGLFAANRRRPMLLLLLLLYYRWGSKNARAANGFYRQRRNGHWEINRTFRTASVPTPPPPPTTRSTLGPRSLRGLNATRTRVGRCAYTVFEKHKSYGLWRTGSVI